MPSQPKTEHTPTPWLLPTTNKGRMPIYIAAKSDETKEGMVVVATIGDFENGPLTYQETAANAALIVLAVNAHDDLVNALRDLQDDVDGFFGDAPPSRFKKSMQKARALLADVKGDK